MSPSSGHPSVFRAAAIALAIGLFSLASFAQQPRVLAPHKPVAPTLPHPVAWNKPAVLQSVLGGLWMIGANFKSSLYLRNDVKTDPITVSPILYLSNGVQYTLPPVKLEPAGTAVLDINQALAAQGLAPYATLSGYVELQYQWAWGAICATVRNIDTVHSLIFIYGLQPPIDDSLAKNSPAASQQAHILEGMWWKRETNVTGFVALSNITRQAINVTVEVSGDANQNLANHSVTVSPHGTKIVNLTELQGAASTSGGILVTQDGPEHGLIINGGLEDEAAGYSAHLPLALLPDATAEVSEASFAELGLMRGAADPMMSFPAGTVFAPYSVLRNLSDQPIPVTPTLWWMEGAAARSAQLPQFTVPPHRTQNMDMSSLLSSAGLKNFNGSVNLVLDTKAQPGALLMASGSVDQKNTYVFEVLPRGVLESASKTLSYWSTANGDDTMVTLWNPADEAQDLVFTLFFTGGHYGFPVHLGPRATQVFNVSEVIHNQIPDSEGNVIPASVHEGSAEISGTRGESEHILVAVDSGVYNVQKATCGSYCQTCNGLTSAWVTDNPFVLAFSTNHQLTFIVQYNTGTQYNRTSYGNWSSSNTGVGTVSTGLVQGVSPGSLTANVIENSGGGESVYGNICNLSCPFATAYPGGSSPGNVTPTVTFSETPVVPQGSTAPITATVTPSNNSTTILLTLSTTSGSGSALFLNGATTMNITTTTGLTILGSQSSSTPNNISLTATVSMDSRTITVGQTSFTVATTGGAVPVNFRQTLVRQDPNASLHFEYTWGSSTGSLSNLQNCQFREFVTYPGYVSGVQAQYYWKTHPYVESWSPNPDTGDTPATATAGFAQDNNGHQGFFPPYDTDDFTSPQVFQFQCPYYQSNQWVTLFPHAGTIAIRRVVSHATNQPWVYTITKSGASNAGNLP